MISKTNILAICGSTRKNSANLQIINAIKELSKEQFEITFYNALDTLPYFNQDIKDENAPASVLTFRKMIEQADGVLICTPEYVFSLPGILKNALEWTVSTTIFSDKPTILITASSSGEKAHESLLLIMKTLGIKTNEDMCLLMSGVKSKLDVNGNVTDIALKERLLNLIAAAVGLINNSL